MAKAGKYVLRDLLWDERTNPVQETVPIFKRHVQGEVLELDEAEATRLVDAGSVEPEGEAEVRQANAALAQARAALANVPDHLRHLVADADPQELAAREVPVEDLTVNGPNAAPGFVNEGHPKYAAAAHGEGGQEDAPDGTTVADLDRTQAALDDGTGETVGPAPEGQGDPVAAANDAKDEGGRKPRGRNVGG